MYQWQKKQRKEYSEFQNDVCVLVYLIKSIWEVLLLWSFILLVMYLTHYHSPSVQCSASCRPTASVKQKRREAAMCTSHRASAELQTHKWQQRCQGWTINCHQEQFSIEMGLSESKQRVSHLTRPALCGISVWGLVWHWKMAFGENRQRTAETKTTVNVTVPSWGGGLLHSACQVQVVEKQGWKGKVKVT